MLAREAGANHGLVHYYFGSMDNLLVRVLERFTERLIERQRAMYAADIPFVEKWRQAMRYLDEDFASGYQKVWYELQALAWNHPELRERVAQRDAHGAQVLREAFEQAGASYEIEMPVDALVTLVMHVQPGDHPRASLGHRDRPRELLDWIDDWLEGGSDDNCVDSSPGVSASRPAPAIRTSRGTSSATASEALLRGLRRG